MVRIPALTPPTFFIRERASGNPWRRPTREKIAGAVRTAENHLENVAWITGSEELAYEVIKIL